jgi:hypothetical protein
MEARLVAALRAIARRDQSTIVAHAWARVMTAWRLPLPGYAAIPLLVIALAGGFWMGRSGAHELPIRPDQAQPILKGSSSGAGQRTGPASAPDDATAAAPEDATATLAALIQPEGLLRGDAEFECTPGDVVEMAARAGGDSL